jgi:hypothetical protein
MEGDSEDSGAEFLFMLTSRWKMALSVDAYDDFLADDKVFD